MSQRRRHSLLEALTSTLFGFLLSMAVWPLVSVHLLHRPAVVSEGLGVVGIYTLISIARGYLVRRVFNRIHAPARPKYCVVCEKPATVRGAAGLWWCQYHGRGPSQ